MYYTGKWESIVLADKSRGCLKMGTVIVEPLEGRAKMGEVDRSQRLDAILLGHWVLRAHPSTHRGVLASETLEGRHCRHRCQQAEEDHRVQACHPGTAQAWQVRR